MKQGRTRRILGLIGLMLALPSQAGAKVPLCEQPPSFVGAKIFDGISVPHLPEKVFVAKSVDLWAIDSSKGVKLFARHNFQSMQSEVRCSNAPFAGPVNFSLWAPALLDLSQDKKWGDSLWQIQVLTEEKRVGVWSQKSRLAPLQEAKKMLQNGIWRALSRESYELIVEQKTGQGKITMRILFDLMNP